MTRGENDRTGMRAGVGKVEITCRDQGVWNDLLAEKVKRHIPPDYLCKPIQVSDPLYVRALLLDDGRNQVVWVTMDVTAIGARTISQHILGDSADDFVPRLRERVERELGLPGSCVNISATHTHQVPRMLCDDEAQLDRTIEAIRIAQRSLTPVTLGVGSGREDSLTFNRTMMMKDGTDYTVRSYHAPMPPDEEVEALREIDPEIGIVRIDHLDGRPLAVLYNFASHLLLGAPDGAVGTITADHVGVVLRYLEENIGGDVMAFATQGAVGDAAEVCQFDTTHPSGSLTFGTTLGQSVLSAYRDTQTGDAAARVVTRRITFALRRDIPDVIAAIKRQQAELVASLRYTSLNFKSFLPLYLQHTMSERFPTNWAYRYLHAEARGDTGWRNLDERNRPVVEKYLESIRAMERMANNEENIATLQKQQEVIESLGTDEVPAEFQGIRIGDCVFITAPMELLTDTAMKVKAMSPFEHTFVMSLSNGYLHYAPPAAYYPRGGYEVTECLLAPAWEAAFFDVVRELLDELQA